MPLKEDKAPRRWPPDKRLARTGFVKKLYERITKQKDRVVRRHANGRSEYGYRQPIILTGDRTKVDGEAIRIQDTAIALYDAFDATVYIVQVENDLCVAEAEARDGAHLWSAKDEQMESLLRTIYNLFPKTKPTSVVKKTNVQDMSLDELQQELERKKVFIEPSHAVPSAAITEDQIKHAQDPAVIEMERKAMEEEMKMVS